MTGKEAFFIFYAIFLSAWSWDSKTERSKMSSLTVLLLNTWYTYSFNIYFDLMDF